MDFSDSLLAGSGEMATSWSTQGAASRRPLVHRYPCGYPALRGVWFKELPVAKATGSSSACSEQCTGLFNVVHEMLANMLFASTAAEMGLYKSNLSEPPLSYLICL